MENTVNKIISIDKDAEKFKKIKQNELKQKKENIDIKIKEMRDGLKKELVKSKIMIEEQELKNAKTECNRINQSKQKEKEEMIKKYNEGKINIINCMIKEILGSSKGE